MRSFSHPGGISTLYMGMSLDKPVASNPGGIPTLHTVFIGFTGFIGFIDSLDRLWIHHRHPIQGVFPPCSQDRLLTHHHPLHQNEAATGNQWLVLSKDTLVRKRYMQPQWQGKDSMYHDPRPVCWYLFRTVQKAGSFLLKFIETRRWVTNGTQQAQKQLVPRKAKLYE